LPDEWLEDASDEMTANDMRAAYVAFIQSRVSKLDQLGKEAEDAR
jgi:hypothetical protein